MQEQIEVWLGKTLVTIVPKVAEPWIRKEYYGKPEERILIIKPRINVSEEEKEKMISEVKSSIAKKLQN